MSEWLATIAPAVADHLWQSTVFAVAAALLTVLLKKNQARTRYWIWLTALIKFLVPLSLLIALGGLLPRPHYAPAATPTAYAAMDAMDTISEPFAAEVLPDAPIHAPKNTIPEAVASVWFCGFCVVVAMWCLHWRRVAAIVREATEPHSGREVEMLRRLERDAGMRPVRFLLSPSSMEPGMFGVFRPVLLWPEGMSARLSDGQMEAILAHELCHVRRRDNLFAVAQMVVETVFWFYPLVWWMGTRMVEERERACDEEVLGQGRSAETYAESILKICEFCLESPLVCVAGITGADLKRRIVQIMSRHFGKELGLGKKVILATAALVAIAGPVAFGVVQMIPLGPLAFGTVQTIPPGTRILHATGPLPSFEVASIRPSASDAESRIIGIGIHPDRMEIWGLSIQDVIEFAYAIPNGNEFSGGPSWIRTERFDITAKPSDAEITKLEKLSHANLEMQMRLMLQSLLQDRFHLKVSFPMKDLPFFALVVAKNGFKCTNAEPYGAGELPPPPPAPPPPLPGGGAPPPPGREQLTHWAQNRVPFGLIVSVIAGQSELSGRTVVDKTGLSGAYNCELSWAREGSEAQGPSFFTALQEQMGLKLVPEKGPVETVLVDHIEEPSGN